MRLNQLYQYLGELIAAGQDPETVVCIHHFDGDLNMELSEIDDADLLTGPYRADPAPKLPAYLTREGTVLLLKAGSDYSGLSETHQIHESPVEVPEKSWPHGWGK
jgi:hypothetical protein